METLYMVIAAIICAVLVIFFDLLLQKAGKKYTFLQKNFIRMPVAYLAGIFIFLVAARILLS